MKDNISDNLNPRQRNLEIVRNDETFFIMDIKPDGNCLFRSIVERFKNSDRHEEYLSDHLRLRAKVVECLRKDENRDSIISTLSDEKRVESSNITGEDISAYINNMSKDATWGGTPELVVIANLLNVRIVVHYHDRGDIKLPQGSDYDAREEIHIMHESADGKKGANCNHYNLVINAELKNQIEKNNAREARIERGKKTDLEKLVEICALIDQFNKKNESLEQHRKLLCEIGVRAKAIEYDDKNKSSIRNKYGDKDRSNDAADRKGGVEFYHLGALQKVGGYFAENRLPAVKSGLSNVKKKLKFIIKLERNEGKLKYEDILKEFENIDNSAFHGVIRDFYCVDLLKEIHRILDDDLMKSLDFSKREDRYYFGRVLSVIGELSREFEGFTTSENNNNNMFRFFKFIRDKKMAHLRNAFVDDLEESRVVALNLLRSVVENFKLGIRQILADAEKNQSYQFGAGVVSEEEKLELNKLAFNIFSSKSAKTLDEEMLLKIQIRQDLKEEPQGKEALDKTKNVKKEKEVKNKSSTALSPHKLLELMETKVQKIQNLDDKPKNKKMKERISQEVLNMVKLYNGKIESESLRMAEGSVPSVENIDSVKSQLKDEHIKIEEHEEPKPEEGFLDDDKGENVDKSDAGDVSVDVSRCMNYAYKELEYMSFIVNSQDIEENKKDYVLAFSYSKLGQIFRDLQDRGKMFLSKEANESFLESVGVTEKTRNKLMHGFLFPDKDFDMNHSLFRHSLPIMPEIEAIKEVMKYQDLDHNRLDGSSQIDSFIKFARALTKLEKYDLSLEVLVSVVNFCFAQMLESQDSLGEYVLGVINSLRSIAETYDAKVKKIQVKLIKDAVNSLEEEILILMEKKIETLELYMLIIEATGIQSDLAVSSAHNSIAVSLEALCRFDKAIGHHELALKITMSQKKVDLDKKMLYLMNYAVTYCSKYENNLFRSIRKSSLAGQISVEELSSDRNMLFENMPKINLAIACLWEVCDYFEKVDKIKYIHAMIRLMQSLSQSFGVRNDFRNVICAFKLSEKFDKLIAKFPAKEASEIVQGYRVVRDSIHMFKRNLIKNHKMQFEREEKRYQDLQNVEFKLERLELLKTFFVDIGISDEDLDGRIAAIKENLASGVESDESKFISGVVYIKNRGSTYLRNRNPREALKLYLEALKNLKNLKSKDYNSQILPEIYENIGDAFMALNNQNQAISNYKQSIAMHIEYELDDRAYRIPLKIAYASAELIKDGKKPHEDTFVETLNYLKDVKKAFIEKNGAKDLRILQVDRAISWYKTCRNDVSQYRYLAISDVILRSYKKMLQNKKVKDVSSDVVISFECMFSFEEVLNYIKGDLGMDENDLVVDEKGQFFLTLSALHQTILSGWKERSLML